MLPNLNFVQSCFRVLQLHCFHGNGEWCHVTVDRGPYGPCASPSGNTLYTCSYTTKQHHLKVRPGWRWPLETQLSLLSHINRPFHEISLRFFFFLCLCRSNLVIHHQRRWLTASVPVWKTACSHTSESEQRAQHATTGEFSDVQSQNESSASDNWSFCQFYLFRVCDLKAAWDHDGRGSGCAAIFVKPSDTVKLTLNSESLLDSDTRFFHEIQKVE